MTSVMKDTKYVLLFSYLPSLLMLYLDTFPFIYFFDLLLSNKLLGVGCHDIFCRVVAIINLCLKLKNNVVLTRVKIDLSPICFCLHSLTNKTVVMFKVQQEGVTILLWSLPKVAVTIFKHIVTIFVVANMPGKMRPYNNNNNTKVGVVCYEDETFLWLD